MTLAPFVVPRPALFARLREAAASGAPVLLAGPPGSGKTTLLLDLQERLSPRQPVAYLDLMAAASSPERFVRNALDVLPASLGPSALRSGVEVLRQADSGKSGGAAAVEALFDLWRGAPDLALLLDDATEIRSLAYFEGLREIDQALAACVRARPGPTVLATSRVALARERWPELAVFEVPELEVTEVAAVLPRSLGDPAALVRAGYGRPRYVRILAQAMEAGGLSLASAWAQEMARDGRLELACRHVYESLLLRSRGYGTSKAILATVAAEEGLNLTALVARLGRTPGAIRDYLGWLLHVDALRMVQKRYVYVDGMLRGWVRLHARPTPATSEEIAEAAETVVRGDVSTAVIASVDEGPDEDADAPLPRRVHDGLMEID